jgi:gliding motility-associated-like protein
LYSNCGAQQDTFTVNITVHPKPDPGFTVYSNCLNETTIFTNTSGILSGSISSYLWDFGNNTTSTLNQPTHTYTSTGTYNVHLTATSDQGCIHDTVRQVMVHPNPVAAFSHTEACAGGTIEFTDLSTTPGGTINQWFWQGNTGEPWQPGASTHSILYASAGNYTPTLAVENSFGCNDTISDQLTILPKPVANFIVTDECLGSPTRYVNLTSGLIPASALVFDWDLGDGTTYNGFQPLPYTYSNFGLYTVTLSIDDPVRSGCQDDTSFIATVHAIPEPFFLNVPDNCQPYSVTFSDASNVFNNTISRWYWDFGNGESSVKQNPTVVYTNSGTYTISLSVESQAGCQSAAPHIQEIEVYPKPFADFIYDPQMPTILFADISFRERCLGEIEYLWNFGDGSGSTEANPRHLYSDPGEYEVWLEATSDKGCKDTVTKILEVVNDYSLFIPNAFSPNADGKNETFRPEAFNITDYRLEIFDRWGEVLFTTLNLEQGWNGIYGEKECPEAIYVYKLNYKDPFNEVHYKTGWFALIR